MNTERVNKWFVKHGERNLPDNLCNLVNLAIVQLDFAMSFLSKTSGKDSASWKLALARHVALCRYRDLKILGFEEIGDSIVESYKKD